MVRLHTFAWGLALALTPLFGQAPLSDAALDSEKKELAVAVQEASTSGFDMIRALEAHLRKYPNTNLRADILPLLAKASLDAKDTTRIVRYGEPVLVTVPNDVVLLDRVSSSLLTLGGKENTAKALGYAKRFEDYVIRIPVPQGYDPVKNQEDHDRALARALLYQARAHLALGSFDDARRSAALAYIAYPDAASARLWAEALDKMSRGEDAVARMADAFAIPDSRVTADERAADRKRLGVLYRKLHNDSEAGMGEDILTAYDRTSATMDKHNAQLRVLDPNLGLTDPMNFTLPALGGGKLNLTTMRGKVVIFDFWATWCVPCRAQHPLYEEVKKRFRDRDDVVFLSVNTDEESSLVAPFLEAQHWAGNVFFDGGLVRLLYINSIPTTMVGDKEGHLVSRMDGFLGDTFVEQLTARVRAALAGPIDFGPPGRR